MSTPASNPDKYYIGMWNGQRYVFYVWTGDGWLFAPADPSLWGFRHFTFTRMTADVARDTIAEIRATPQEDCDPCLWASLHLFLIPVEDAPIWGLPAGGE